MATYKALRAHKTSIPFSYPSLDTCHMHSLKDNELRIRMLYAPVNPADINMLEGRYVIRPFCPFILGNEGVGIVEEVGQSINSSWIGKRVICPFQHPDNWLGFWTQYQVVFENQCIEVPDFIEDKQAAMLSINPLTAMVMIQNGQSLKDGDWIIQNAANSSVGRWVLYVAKHLSLKTVNLVRCHSLHAELTQLGADSVVTFSDNVSSQINQKGNCSLALNGVGGVFASEIARCLKPFGTMVTYGAMSKEPVTLGNGLMIYKSISVRGFNRSIWGKISGQDVIRGYFKQLFLWLSNVPFSIPINGVFPLDDNRNALEAASQSVSRGKVLFKLT